MQRKSLDPIKVPPIARQQRQARQHGHRRNPQIVPADSLIDFGMLRLQSRSDAGIGHDRHPSARHTRLRDRVSGRLARFIVTSTLEQLERTNRTHLGYPIQGELTRPFKTIDDGLFYAGQGAPLLSHHNATGLTRALAALID